MLFRGPQHQKKTSLNRALDNAIWHKKREKSHLQNRNVFDP